MLRILIADDNSNMRQRVRSLVESEEDWSVCGEAANGREALDLVRQLRPDVCLLDISMPQMNGVEVTRRVASESPDIDILVLTMHRTSELAREVVRAGASAIIDKSEAWERLNPAIRALQSDMCIAGRVVGRSRHIGAFFDSMDEAYRVLAPFMCDGFDAGEKGIHLIDSHTEAEHLSELEECELEPREIVDQGLLDIVPWNDAYLRNGRFDMHWMLSFVPELLSTGPRSGFPRTRLFARMEWASQEPPGHEDLVEYESRLNDVLPQFMGAVTCVYDVSRFDPRLIDDLKRAHPALLVGDEYYENPDYLPPEEMLEELRQRSH